MRRLHIVRRLLHWAVAILVLLMIPAGLIIADFDNRGPLETVFGEGAFDALYSAHKSVGVTVLALALLRIAALLVWPAPEHGPALTGWRLRAAKLNHGALYALLIVVPILGWMGVSAYRAPVPVFGLFEAPPIAAENRPVSEFLLGWHRALALTLAAVAAIHIAAAIQHRNIRRDGIFDRISLFGRRSDAPPPSPRAEAPRGRRT